MACWLARWRGIRPVCRDWPHSQRSLPDLLLCCAAQVLVAERGPLVWVFNFSPFNTYEGLQVGPAL